MDPMTRHDEQPETKAYEAPKVTDYGTLQELTEVGGTVNPSDIPHGHPLTAYPLS